MTTKDDNKKTIRIIFRVKPEIYHKLVDRAVVEQRSLSSVVNVIVSRAIEEDEKRDKK